MDQAPFAALPADVLRTHWSNGQGNSRLLIVKTASDLAYETTYEVSVAPGIRLADGRTLSREYAIQFTTGCDTDGGACAADAGPDASSDAGASPHDAGARPSDAASTADVPAEAPRGSEGGCSCAQIRL